MGTNDTTDRLREAPGGTATAPADAWRGVTDASARQASRDDWQVLFAAVTDRLHALAGAVAGDAAVVGAGLQDCIAALDQVRQALALDGPRRQPRAHDLVVLRAEDRRARRLARLDLLTGLPNRAFLLAELTQALGPGAAGTPALGLLYIELNGMQAADDTHGHGFGDAMLRIAAGRLSRSLRDQDRVARVGGNTFACLIGSAIERMALIHLALKLHDALSAPMRIRGIDIGALPCIGISTGPHDGQNAQALLRHADAAKFRAQREHSGYAFYDARIDA